MFQICHYWYSKCAMKGKIMNDFYCEVDKPLVKTKGGNVRGYYYDGNYIFKGIPYARARRFHAPEEYPSWEGNLNATNYGCVSPLLHYEKPAAELFFTHRNWVEGEDCQNLNVWTTDLEPKELKPVFVWIHGGGFSDGSSIEGECYDGSDLTKAADCVFVSVNHRLNVFGYLDFSDFGEEYENSGNNGMLDLIAALKWVKDNITAFGGNPSCVTICGQSGGGGKVTALLQMPQADGLYHRAMILSGEVATHDAEVLGSARDCVEAMMEVLQISDVHEMEKVPFRLVADAYNKVMPRIAKEGKNIGCMPIRNEYFAGNPLRVNWREGSLKVPLIIGACYSEFLTFDGRGIVKSRLSEEEGKKIIEEKAGKDAAEELVAAFKKAYPDRNPVDILFADWLFRAPTSKHARLRASQGGKVYSYQVALDFPIEGGRGAWHGADLPFLMHNAGKFPLINIPEAADIQDRIAAALSAFMRTGDPNCDAIPAWEPVSENSEPVLLIEKTFRVVPDYDQEFLPLQMKYAEKLGTGTIHHDFDED